MNEVETNAAPLRPRAEIAVDLMEAAHRLYAVTQRLRGLTAGQAEAATPDDAAPEPVPAHDGPVPYMRYCPAE